MTAPRLFREKIARAIRPEFRRSRSASHVRIWMLSLVLLAVVSLVPLTLMTIFEHQLSHEAIYHENKLRVLRLTSNTRRTLSYFFEERLNALRFIVEEEGYSRLSSDTHLTEVLRNLKYGFGSVTDIGVIEDTGRQLAYAGPFNLQSKDYSKQEWFRQTLRHGAYVSNVFLGYRERPHIIVAVKSQRDEERDYVLRATLDMQRLNEILSTLELDEKSVSFLINRKGTIQTESRYFGDRLENFPLEVPEYSPNTSIYQTDVPDGRDMLIGYAYIENTPFILMLAKDRSEIMHSWYSLQKNLIIFFSASVVVILMAIYLIPTYIIDKLYEAERTRSEAIQNLEQTARLASIGRLAAGVAHEINNPLAVINEKIGLLRDMIIFKKEYSSDPKLLKLVDSVLDYVERCGAVTQQLLGFARHTHVQVKKMHVEKIITDVLSFLEKEAQHRSIEVNLYIPEETPEIISDRVKLQQIFLNLVNNAFQAVSDGGRIDIAANKADKNRVAVSVTDNGCGISQKDQKKLFEPFFSTKKDQGGTGLGLSITYGLVQKLGGEISVDSELGQGTTFTVILPIENKEEKHD